MLLEESLEGYLRIKRTEFLKNISQILFFTFFPLTFFSLCLYQYFSSFLWLFLFLFYLLSSICFFLVRHYLFKRNLLLSSLIISLIFFCISLIAVFSGSFTALSMISFLISFTVVLISLGEKWAFGMIVFSLFSLVLILFFREGQLLLQSFFPYACLALGTFFEIKSYWLFFFLLFLLFQGCIMRETYNGYVRRSLEKYKYLANLKYKHALFGKISKCLIHDISTPLSILSGSIKLLESVKLTSREISNVKDSAVNALEYLESILDNSFILLRDSKSKKSFQGDNTVRKVLHLVKSRFKKAEIVVESKLNSRQWLYGNESLFARAVLNVLVNSMEDLERSKKRGRVVEIVSRVKKGMYVLSIKDNGKGIRGEVLKSVRNKEITLKNQAHLGLGLHFVLDIVENHFRGVLEIESVQKESTEVVFKIPC